MGANNDQEGRKPRWTQITVQLEHGALKRAWRPYRTGHDVGVEVLGQQLQNPVSKRPHA